MGPSNASSPYFATKCRCIGTCNNDQEESICDLKERAKCYKVLRVIDGEYLEEAGCLGSSDNSVDQCNAAANPKFHDNRKMECCWDKDMCNDEIDLFGQLEDEESPQDYTTLTIVAVVMIVAILAALALALVFILSRRRKKNVKKQEDTDEESYMGDFKSKSLHEIIDDYSTPCSSGSGVPLMVQRTIARQIEIIREIGRGRYGTVMLGKWQDEYVAVKMFHSTEEKSWDRETNMYQTVLLRHDNILCFIASDINGTGSWTQLYLVTDYHPNGSLHDYLQTRALDVPSALKLAHSASCGLAHLHTEIIGTQGNFANQGKSAMAHCDIKSKNILVKADGACCIADMGLAVLYTSSREDGGGHLDKGHYTKGKQGTIRYMSPEILNGKFNDRAFDSFKATDVYSFALVLWEILNCTTVQGYDATGNYRVPYYDDVSSDPDFDEMRKVVDVEGIRPEVLAQHSKHQTLARYVKMMSEGWVQRAESRLTMLRIRKTLGTLRHGCNDDALPVVVAYQPSNASSAYVSDRSNSSGFPTESTYGRGFSDPKSGYEFLPSTDKADSPLISSGFGDANRRDMSVL